MHLSYLLKYISYHHHTYVRSYSLDRKLIDSFCGRYEFRDIFNELPSDRTLNVSDKTELLHAIRVAELDLLSPGPLPAFAESLPKLTLVNDSVIYATVFTAKHFFLLGPVRFDGETLLTHCLHALAFSESFLENVPLVSYQHFLEDLMLLHNLFHNKEITGRDIFLYNFPQSEIEYTIQKNYGEIVFENQEYGTHHNPYDQELREQNSIKNGDLEQLQKSWEEDYVGQIGSLASNKLRSVKNVGIVLITLSSRSAIAGGVLPEVAFSLSDSFCKHIESASNIEMVKQIARAAEIQYTNLVHDLQIQRKKKEVALDEQHPKIGKCKDYIFHHLHEKILVSEIAEELQIHPNYLSDLFKKIEGMSISDFILREKIKLAKNLLIYSEYSYIEIATYLGFSSQSHLGNVFKKKTGMTPHAFRKKYGQNISFY